MSKKTLSLFSLVLGLIADAVALAFLLPSAERQGSAPVWGWALHALAVLLALPGLVFVLPAGYSTRRSTFFALVAGFAAPAPLIGLIFLMLFGRLFAVRPSFHSEGKYFYGERQVLTQVVIEPPGTDSRQSILGILNGKDSAVRRKAILALRSVEPRKSLPVLQKAIQDSDEQVRLLAQTQFNRILASLELSIKSMEAELAAGARTGEKLIRLSEQYQELVYLGLSSEETQTIYLDRAIELLREALELAPDNAGTLLMLMKCYVKNRSVDRAQECLEQLKSLGCEYQFTLPWEAEISFLKRDWRALAGLMRQMQNDPTVDPKLRGLAEFWLGPQQGEANA
jgi:pentatricopeptide repeat protein